MKFKMLTCLVILLAASCGKGTGGGGDDSNICGGSSKGCVAGEVVSSTGGAGIGTALLKVADALIATANGQGWFYGQGIERGLTSLCFSADGFVTSCRNVEIIAHEVVSMTQTELVPEMVDDTFDAGAGATFEDPNTGAKVEFPAASLCEADRTTLVTGEVACTLTPINVTTTDIDTLPGDFSSNDGTTTGLMQVSATMNVTCTQNDAVLDICEGKTVAAVLPIFGTEADCLDVDINPSPAGSWRFDMDAGLWRSRDAAVRSCGVNPSDRFYATLFDYLGWWSAGLQYTPTCLKGTIVDEQGSPVTGALIKCRGVDYQGLSFAYSQSNSSFCVEVKPDGEYSCIAAKGNFSSTAKTGMAPSATNRCTDGDSSCVSIGQFALVDPSFRTILTWGELPPDLDSHFVGDGVHVFFGSKGSMISPPYVELDTDDADSFGPEITSAAPSLDPGTYYFCVHNFSGEAKGPIAESGAQINVFGAGIGNQYDVPTSNPDGFNLWRVYQVNIDSNGMPTFSTINNFVDGSASVVNACSGS